MALKVYSNSPYVALTRYRKPAFAHQRFEPRLATAKSRANAAPSASPLQRLLSAASTKQLMRCCAPLRLVFDAKRHGLAGTVDARQKLWQAKLACMTLAETASYRSIDVSDTSTQPLLIHSLLGLALDATLATLAADEQIHPPCASKTQLYNSTCGSSADEKPCLWYSKDDGWLKNCVF